jgi:hypothetical protein
MQCKKGPIITLTCLRICLMAVVITALVMGCASTGSEIPPVSSRDEIQTTHHWDLIARDVATQIQLALGNAGIYDPVPIYLKTSDETPFGQTFRRLLTNQLEKLGISLVWKETDAVLFIDNTVIVICQDERRVADPLSGTFEIFTDLSEAMVVARSGVSQAVEADDRSVKEMDTGERTKALPPTEVIITTQLASEVDYLMQNSDIYYISDPDFRCHWTSPLVQEEIPEPTTEETSEPVSEQISEEIPGQTPEEIPEEMSEETPGQIPEELSEPAPEQISEQIPGQAPEDIAEQVPYQTPAEVPGETPEQISKQILEQAPEQISEQVPEQYKKPTPTVKVKGLF